MEYEAIITSIGTVGFPIVACIIMFWYLNNEKEAHKEEMDAVNRTLTENTTVLASLKSMIETLVKVLEK